VQLSSRSRLASRAPLGALLAAASVLAVAGPLSVATAASASPDACAALEATTRQPDPVLGGGITVSTGVDGNVFPAGTPASLSVSPGSAAAGQSLRVTVVNDARRQVSSSAITLPTDGSSSTVSLPSNPGWFKVNVQRLSGSSVVGAACVWYGVAPAGSSLDPASLPAGTDWGGPAPLRDVALHAQMKLPVVREGINLPAFVANPVGDPGLASAAFLAAKAKLFFVVQVGQGGPTETAAVAHGTWGALVQKIVAANPAVPYWEAWNEPNTSQFFTGTAADYVKKVLAPFAAAVHKANPHARVVGGSALSDDVEWWQDFAKAGGFKYVDVIGVHPYTWGWGAPETEGMLDVLTSVKSLAAKYGAGKKPIFDTESGWPSAWQGVAASIWTQADFVARKAVIEHALGVWSGEFLLEGGWQDWPVIDQVRGVKPAGMTLTYASTLLNGRKFLGWWATGVSGTRAARFGPRVGDKNGVTAVWSLGASVRVPLKCSASGHDAYGAPVSAKGSAVVSGSPTFLTGASGGAAGCLVGKPSKT